MFSYKVFNAFHLGPVTTYVHYLEPIYYDEYKDMKSVDIAKEVKCRIETVIKMQESVCRLPLPRDTADVSRLNLR